MIDEIKSIKRRVAFDYSSEVGSSPILEGCEL